LSVLGASPPRFSTEEAAAIAAKLFDLRGDAVDLGSERDPKPRCPISSD
jgi:hypothetical protein